MGTFDLGRELVNGHIQVNNNIWPDVWKVTQPVQSIYTWFFKRKVYHIAKFSPKTSAVIRFFPRGLWRQQDCSGYVDILHFLLRNTLHGISCRDIMTSGKWFPMHVSEFEKQELFCSMSLLDWCYNQGSSTLVFWFMIYFGDHVLWSNLSSASLPNRFDGVRLLQMVYDWLRLDIYVCSDPRVCKWIARPWLCVFVPVIERSNTSNTPLIEGWLLSLSWCICLFQCRDRPVKPCTSIYSK